VARDEDHGHLAACCGEFVLKLETTDIGHADVEHQATRCIRCRAPEKVVSRRKTFDAQPTRCDHRGERFAHGSIVVDDKDNRVQLIQIARGAVGGSDFPGEHRDEI